jgi:hypothetical protein
MTKKELKEIENSRKQAQIELDLWEAIQKHVPVDVAILLRALANMIGRVAHKYL